MSIAIRSFGVCLKKEPLPLKKPLDLLDEKLLAPYKVVSKHKIENEEIVKSLGTENYIQWVLKDVNAAPDSTAGKCMLFITYYDLPDVVVHVPEECYAGSGYQKIASEIKGGDVSFWQKIKNKLFGSAGDSITFEISNNAGFTKNIGGKYLVFGKTGSNLSLEMDKFPVLYLFRVNGDYAGSRGKTRMALNKNLFHKSSYYCKVEVVFNQSLVAPSREQAITASEKLLAVVLPVLESQHWPDWPVLKGK